jgi:ATP-dependent Clp protease ATP-binding subunit ClpA
MRSTFEPPRRNAATEGLDQLEAALSAYIVGQPEAVNAVAPYVRLYQASLSPDGRPVGVFLLLGPSGTGKTRTVEALAQVLHGDEKKVVKIDCGEFQMEHEVAKLIGAPPGYLGHKETTPMLNQARLNQTTSDRSSLSIVLFDEIEKAAPSLQRLLLGVLDKALLRLGDNTTVAFDRSIIFLTSNLGARDMLKMLKPGFGFAGPRPERIEAVDRLREIGLNAVRRHFSPEFVNRIDSIVAYQPLDSLALEEILDQQLRRLQRHLMERMSVRSFTVEVDENARAFLLSEGVSEEYGARELKRTIHRRILQPLASLVAANRIPPMGFLRVTVSDDGDGLDLNPEPPRSRSQRRDPVRPPIDE